MLIFLMCSERSGSNFITKLVNGHSQIVGPSVKHLFNPVLRNYFRYGDLNCEDNWNELLEDILNLFQADFSIWKLELSLKKLSGFAAPGDISTLLKSIFEAEAELNDKDHIFIKENQIYEFFPYLLLNYPEAKYLYQVRDPRDMALSWKRNENLPGGIIRAARQWKKDQQNSLKNMTLLKDKCYFIKYEELIEDPQKNLDKICQFFSLSYEEEMLSFHKDELTQKNAVMNTAWENLSKGIIADNKNKYLKALSETEIKLIEKICYDEMLYLQYKPLFSESDLENISDDETQEFEIQEKNTLKHSPTEGILENMRAKKRFYKHRVLASKI